MARPPLAPWRCAVIALVALLASTSVARTGGAAALPVASPAGRAAGGSTSGDGYPDWAAAVVPAYTSHVKNKGRTTDQFYDVYQINTTDPYETVLSWYKAHVQTRWPDRHPDQTVGKVGDIHITLQNSDGKLTSIGFTKKR